MNVQAYIREDPYKAPCYYCQSFHKAFVYGVLHLEYVYYICIPCFKKHMSETTICRLRRSHFKELVLDMKLKR